MCQQFFMYLAYNAVHTPMHAKEEDIEQFAGIEKKKRRILAAMTRSMDENIGRLKQKLDKLNLTDNTLIIFLNDNGGRPIMHQSICHCAVIKEPIGKVEFVFRLSFPGQNNCQKVPGLNTLFLRWIYFQPVLQRVVEKSLSPGNWME
ncbi:sulfatase-like hydrolase/transferase [candidate division KSB1 bacterium]|nr:sulfatase-like hydrolase/transferase [candidate division KSB1 bacterium]